MTAPTVEVLSAPPTWPQQADDRYRYGWREVRREAPEGEELWERVPLTLEDVLHPQVGDFIVHSEAHERRNLYVYDVFTARVADDPSAVVLHDVRVAWDVPGLKAHGPDIAVIFGVRERKNWSTFDVAVEGTRPILLVEITSPETASTDRSNKLEEYALAGVAYYVIIDTLIQAGQPHLLLLGYRQGPTGFQVVAPDERGWLWLPPVRVWLGIADNELVCYDEAGQPLGDYRALSLALASETLARAVAEQRALAAEERLRQLEAELRGLRGIDRE